MFLSGVTMLVRGLEPGAFESLLWLESWMVMRQETTLWGSQESQFAPGICCRCVSPLVCLRLHLHNICIYIYIYLHTQKYNIYIYQQFFRKKGMTSWRFYLKNMFFFYVTYREKVTSMYLIDSWLIYFALGPKKSVHVQPVGLPGPWEVFDGCLPSTLQHFHGSYHSNFDFNVQRWCWRLHRPSW